MNFLAHAFLTPENGQMLVGNFFGDSFKGRPENHGPIMITEGIRLHRSIDYFTDTHPLVLQAVDLFRAQQKRFAAVVTDLVFDHLLASKFGQWSNADLRTFTASIFERIDQEAQHIPEKALVFYSHLKKHNWLLHYSKMRGLQLSLEGMDRRVSVATELVKCIGLVEIHRAELNELFNIFFIDLQDHVKIHLDNMDSDMGSSRVPLK